MITDFFIFQVSCSIFWPLLFNKFLFLPFFSFGLFCLSGASFPFLLLAFFWLFSDCGCLLVFVTVRRSPLPVLPLCSPVVPLCVARFPLLFVPSSLVSSVLRRRLPLQPRPSAAFPPTLARLPVGLSTTVGLSALIMALFRGVLRTPLLLSALHLPLIHVVSLWRCHPDLELPIIWRSWPFYAIPPVALFGSSFPSSFAGATQLSGRHSLFFPAHRPPSSWLSCQSLLFLPISPPHSAWSSIYEAFTVEFLDYDISLHTATRCGHISSYWFF